jgi:hypothetical protein
MARVYKQANIFNARIVNMRNLWEPSREYMGKPTEKPNYLASFIVPKTRANWFEEPPFADFVRAAQELYTASLSHIPFPQVIWPIKDGDAPEPGKNSPDWMKGNWYLTGSSTSPINVTIVQAGVPVALMNRAQVKSGDYIAAGVALAVKANDPRGVKCYLNTVMFMSAGEEIVVGSSVSSSELMAQAKAQGLNVTGFGAGSAGLLPQVGFSHGFAGPGMLLSGNPVGMPGNGAQLPSNTGPNAPQTAFPFDRHGFAPSPAQPPASPSGFGAPAGFTPPQGFPQR